MDKLIQKLLVPIVRIIMLVRLLFMATKHLQLLEVLLKARITVGKEQKHMISPPTNGLTKPTIPTQSKF